MKMVLEIFKDDIRKFGSIQACIDNLQYMVWTPERIKGAFNFGNGTSEHFREFKKNNAKYSVFVEKEV